LKKKQSSGFGPKLGSLVVGPVRKGTGDEGSRTLNLKLVKLSG